MMIHPLRSWPCSQPWGRRQGGGHTVPRPLARYGCREGVRPIFPSKMNRSDELRPRSRLPPMTGSTRRGTGIRLRSMSCSSPMVQECSNDHLHRGRSCGPLPGCSVVEDECVIDDQICRLGHNALVPDDYGMLFAPCAATWPDIARIIRIAMIRDILSTHKSSSHSGG